ncbi:uncharacterized protein LOC132281265 [Cornus florida]|uniref:uncharacterized protein LOC132281265 n=1 Tax=Cornus florida TaxID=4283 RepID=UPI00289B8412|nr:uncharacterized protein LOC132281265 [Cornus florida]
MKVNRPRIACESESAESSSEAWFAGKRRGHKWEVYLQICIHSGTPTSPILIIHVTKFRQNLQTRFNEEDACLELTGEKKTLSRSFIFTSIVSISTQDLGKLQYLPRRVTYYIFFTIEINIHYLGHDAREQTERRGRPAHSPLSLAHTKPSLFSLRSLLFSSIPPHFLGSIFYFCCIATKISSTCPISAPSLLTDTDALSAEDRDGLVNALKLVVVNIPIHRSTGSMMMKKGPTYPYTDQRLSLIDCYL